MTDTFDLQVNTESAVLTCIGDLDVNCADELRRAIGAATRTGVATVVIDISRTEMVDSTTLGVLLHANTSCNDSGSTLVIAGAPRIVARSIALTGLDRVLNQAPDVAAALATGNTQ